MRTWRVDVMPGRVTGAGMVEVLVALLVATVGILGLASAHLVALRAAHEAHQQVTALDLATSWMELSRENPSLAAAYPSIEVGRGGPVDPVPDPNCPAPCGPRSGAERDMAVFSAWLGSHHVRAGGEPAGGLGVPLACLEFDGDRQLATLAWWGSTPQTPTPAPPCGDSAAYDDPDYPAGNRMRQRVLRLATRMPAVTT